MDLECVESLIVLAEEEHFGRAAARLHVGAPALSKRIHRLERQVGAALVEHDPCGGFALTAAGLRFLQHAGPLLREARLAQEAAMPGAECPVRLGVPGRLGETPGRRELAELSARLRRRRPADRFACLGIPYSLVVDSLLGDRVDVVWATAAIKHPELDSVPLTRAWRAAVVPRHHPLADAAMAGAEDFAALPLLHDPQVEFGMMSRAWLADFPSPDGAIPVPIGARHFGEVLRGVAEEKGVAVVLESMVPLAAGRGLRGVSLVGLPPVEVHAVRRRADTRYDVLELVRCLGPIAVDESRTGSVRREVPGHGPRVPTE